MKRSLWSIGVIALVLVGGAAAAHAEETGASSAATTGAASAVGTISAINLQSAKPSITVSDASGHSWSFGVDAGMTSVRNGTQAAQLATLKTGDHVMVRYVTKDGEPWAKSIHISNASAVTPAASSPMPTTSGNEPKAAY